MQPEVWHFAGYPRGQVDNKGDLNLTVPVLTVPGRGGLDFEVAFNYHAPIPVRQQASWIGLGWSFDPGSITRDPQAGVKPLGSIGGSGVDFAYVDTLQPDMYYLTIPGQGSLPMSRSNRPEFYDFFLKGFNYLGKQYVPLNPSQFYLHSWKPWKIDIETDTSTVIAIPPGSANRPQRYDCLDVREITQFKVTTENGMRYVFGTPSLARYKTSYYGMCSFDQYISVWRLIAILSPECPDTITVPDENTPGNWIKFLYRFDASNAIFTAVSSEGFLQSTYLWKIVTPTHVAEFETASRYDVDMKPFEEYAHRKLTAIHLFKQGFGDTLKSVYLHQSKTLCNNQNPYENRGKTTLDSISFRGRKGVAERGYKFTYVDYNPPYPALHGQNDDDFGYFDTGGWSTNFDANPDDAKAWSLETIYYPTGGSETYEYENDEMFANFANREQIKIEFDRYFQQYTPPQYNHSTEYYYFKQNDDYRFRQGGTRVTKITRKDAAGNEIVESYHYGSGFPTTVPPGFFARWGEWAYYTPGNRGNAAVIYPYVQKISSTGTIELRYYSMPDIDTSGEPVPNLDSFGTISLMYIDQLDLGKTVAMGNEDVLWGHNIKTTVLTVGHYLDTEKKYFTALAHDYQNMSEAFELPAYGNATVYIKWFNPYVDSLFIAENDLQKITTYDYRTGPRFPRKTIEIGSDGAKRITETTYAFEIGNYGGDSSNVAGMRAKNMLRQTAQTVQYSDSAAIKKYYRSGVTKWKEDPGEESFWKPYREYHWRKDGPQGSFPAFTAWAPVSTPNSDWQRAKTYQDYDDYGQLTAVQDANGNTTEIFYGDNANNFSNSANGLAHAYITGIRKNNLELAYDYDEQTGQITSMTDANGQTTSFYYDHFGRYAGTANPEGQVTGEFSYYLSGDTSGAVRNYIESLAYPNGNLLKNSSFEINAPGNLLSYWNTSGAAFQVKKEMADAILGNAYIKVSTSAYGETSYNISLLANREYIISGWMRKISGSAQPRITLKGLNGKFQYLNKSAGSSYGTSGNDVYLQKTVSGSAWERIWLKFRCTQAASIQVKISSQSNEVYADNLILSPLLTHQSDAVFPDDIEPRVLIDYYDGLGQKIQIINSAGPYRLLQQIITHFDYDADGRLKRQWKPFPSQKSDALGTLAAFEPLATDSGHARSAYAYYDGDPGPDAGGFPYTEYVYGANSDFIPYTFFPGEEFHLPPGSDPFIYPPVHPSNFDHYLTVRYETNRGSDGLNYPDNSLRKIITVDENKNYTLAFLDKFGQTIRQVSHEKGTGEVSINVQALADTIYFPYTSKSFHITASVHESIDVHWKATMSNLSGTAELKVGSSPGASNLIYRSSTEDKEETIPLELVAGSTYYFRVTAATATGESTGGSPFIETDKYVSSAVWFTFTSIGIEYYTPLAITEFQYDGAGNLVKVLPPNYFNPPGSSSPADWVTRYTYNTLGQMTAKETPDAGQSQYKYDPNGNLRFSRDANLTAAGRVMFTAYDFANRPLRNGTAAANFSSLAGENSYTFENDSANWLQVNCYDQPPPANEFPWNHNPAVTPCLDSLTNTGGRITADAYKVGDGESVDYLHLQNQAVSVTKTYIGNDSIVAGPSFTVESGGEVTFKAGSRIVLKPGFHAKSGSSFHAEINASLLTNPVKIDLWQVTLYSYDPSGRIEKKYICTDDAPQVSRTFIANAQGQVVESHDKVGAEQFHHFYEYTPRGELAKTFVSQNNSKPAYSDVVFDYNNVGLLATQHFVQTGGSSYQTSVPFKYHIRDWLTEIGNVSDANKPFGAKYTFLPDGNIQEAEFYNKQAGMHPRFKYDYGYDGMNRLLKADYSHYASGWQSGAYFDVDTLTYDANGNILGLKRRKENQALIDDLTYTYSNSNRLQSVADAVNTTPEDWDAEDCAFTYDANGNLKSMTENGAAKIDSIIYDVRNLPVRIYMHSGPQITYRYNAAGQRIFKKVGNNEAEWYIMDGDRNLAVFNENGSLTYWNVLANGVVGRMEANGDRFYYLKDHLGSTRAVMNTNGAVVESYDYYPFGLKMPGRIYPATPTVTKNLFTGKELDGETGWYYHGARFRNPALGPWLSVDPLAEKYPSLSPYAYAANNPINFYDPDGKRLYDSKTDKHITTKQAISYISRAVNNFYSGNQSNALYGFYHKTHIFDIFDNSYYAGYGKHEIIFGLNAVNIYDKNGNFKQLFNKINIRPYS